MFAPSTSTVTGSATKRVVCESCGHEYEYKLTRAASGAYHGFAWTAKEGEQRAAQAAADKLPELLGSGCDVAPCPKCGAITAEMQAEEAGTLWRSLGLTLLGLGMVLGAGVLASNWWQGVWRRPPPGAVYLVAILGIYGIGMALVMGFDFILTLSNSRVRRRNAPPSAECGALPALSEAASLSAPIPVEQSPCAASVQPSEPPTARETKKTPEDTAGGEFEIGVIISTPPEKEATAPWLFYAMARANFVMDHKHLYGAQTGEVVPTFEEEIAARWMLGHSVAAKAKQGEPPPSAYLRDLVQACQAGYLKEYVWWFLNRPSWPQALQPANLYDFMAWARSHLPDHVVQTFGGVNISRGGAASASPPQPPDVRSAGGSELRGQVDEIAELLREGDFGWAGTRLETLAEAVRALQTEAGASYVCFPNARVFDYYMQMPSAPRVVRVLDWCVAQGMYLRVFARSQARQLDEAMACLEEATRLAPLFARPHVEAGYILNRLDRPRQALEAYTRALELATRLPENGSEAAAALRGLGVSRIELGDLNGAERHLRDSLVLEPGNELARNELVYLAQKQRHQ